MRLKRPMCHYKEMEYVFADDGEDQVGFFECMVCGHTKDEEEL
jgi:DNA-directed RNA polymerase subunit M/transcription elongation factor TFIIS